MEKAPNIIRIDNRPEIVTTTPVVLTPGFRPWRTVVVKQPGMYSTRTEYLRIDVVREVVHGVTYDVIVVTHEDYSYGHYFPFGNPTGDTEDQARKKAFLDFNEISQK